MIKRIVKMSFKPENVAVFKTIFEMNWQKISVAEGCLHVELLQDINNPSVFFTYSLWQNEDFLNKYRKSNLFNEVWASTKVLFDAKPEAWSLNQLEF